MNRPLIRLGFVLIFLGLATGLLGPLFTNARLGLASHIVAIFGGLVLIAIGAVYHLFSLGQRAGSFLRWSWIYAAYANWFACLLAAFTGASRLTPIAGAGTSASPLWENVVAFLLQTLAVAALAGTGLAMWGLRERADVPAAAPSTSSVTPG